jgi:hypothetical protein
VKVFSNALFWNALKSNLEQPPTNREKPRRTKPKKGAGFLTVKKANRFAPPEDKPIVFSLHADFSRQEKAWSEIVSG